MKLRKNKNKNIVRAVNKFQPWDYDFTLSILKECLINMSKYHKTDGLAEDSPLYSSRINLALKILDISIEPGIFTNQEYLPASYVNTKNHKRFITTDCNNSYIKAYLRGEKAWNLFCLIMKNDFRKWWD